MNWWTWLLAIWAIALTLGGGAIFFQYKANEDQGLYGDIAGHVIGWILIGIACFSTLIVSIEAIGNHMTAVTCAKWGPANDRPSKFVYYNFWSTDCVTPSGNGHWISTSQLQVNNVTVEKP